MTKPSTAPTAASAELTSNPTADSKLRSLSAADGLFLRAEHLDQIQRYAEEYALAAGVSAASGVDYGLNVSIDGGSLVVSPGLAVDKSRRPLRLSAPATISLSLDQATAELWIVEIVAAAAPIPAGLEPVYGTLCDDPCNGGALAPWRDAAVVIRVRPDQRINGPTSGGLKRSQLASAYFELERSESDPWLPPTGGTPLLKRPWRDGAPSDESVPGAVPIAALLWDDEWVVDTWIARRDVGGPPSRTAWEGHLGLRPWNVFLAQVLQFEAQLASVLDGVAPKMSRGRLAAAELYEKLNSDIDYLQAKKNAAAEVRQFRVDWEHLGDLIVEPTGDVISNAFVELPPAGVIPLADPEDPECRFRELFGADMYVEVEHVRADCALRALEDAQHLERIRPNDYENDSYVRLLVPPVTNGAERWMVFVRGCFPPDYVDVWVRPSDDGDRFDPEKGPDDDKATLVATLLYPHSAWAAPRPPDAMGLIRERVSNGSISRLVGYANADDRRSLAFVRSQLIFFDLSDSLEPAEHPVSSSDVFILPQKKEAILILIDDKGEAVGRLPAKPPAK